MKLNIIEKRRLLKKFWQFRGTTGKKADTITDNQVIAIYAKYEDDIQDMLDLEDYYEHMGNKLSDAKDHWTAEEWDAYTFEEAM